MPADLSHDRPAFRNQSEQDTFPTFTELVEAAQDLAAKSAEAISWSTFGSSRQGEPLGLLTVGEGDRTAVILAGVHPNEPVGGLTGLRLAELLATDVYLQERLGFTWHIAICVDPDGLRLNEGWFKNPGSRPAYEQHCFRPAPDEQVEWVFPLVIGDYKFDRPLPETRAMMSLLDRLKPSLVVSLHNSELGGAYLRLSDPLPALYPRFLEICLDAGVEPARGQPEEPFATMLAPAVMLNGHPADLYARMEPGGDFTVEWGTGSSALHYSEKFGAFGLIPEVPLWTNPLVGPDEPSSITSGEAGRRAGGLLTERGGVIVAALEAAEPYFQMNSPIHRAARSLAPSVIQSGHELLRAAEIDPDEVLTAGQLAALDTKVHMHSIRYGSLLLRAFEMDLEDAPDDVRYASLRGILGSLRVQVDAWREEFARSAQWHPVRIRDLVQVQADSVFAAARALNEQAGRR